MAFSLAADSSFKYNGVPLFSVIQMLVASILIPVSGIMLVVLCAYILPKHKLAAGLGMQVKQPIFRLGYPWLRVFCLPVLLVIQFAMVFDLLLHSCQFDSFRHGAMCAVKSAGHEQADEKNTEVLSAQDDPAIQADVSSGQ